jgi:hypothetical protein
LGLAVNNDRDDDDEKKGKERYPQRSKKREKGSKKRKTSNLKNIPMQTCQEASTRPSFISIPTFISYAPFFIVPLSYGIMDRQADG